jgi:GNAT superfamily N-acetyltransferase
MQSMIQRGDPRAPDVAALLAASEAHARALYPAEGVHMLDAEDLAAPTVRFLVAISARGAAEGCGAIVLKPDGSAEIKRMFVAPEARGKGVGTAILEGLEVCAHEARVRVIRLETGPRQPEAIRLYRGFGYLECGPFGDHHAGAHSVFMEKRLEGSPRSTDGSITPPSR